MKTLEQKLEETKNYLAKSEQHLFVVNDKTITKVITFTKLDVLYYAKLQITGDNVYLNAYSADTMKWNAKNILFPQYVKTKSIPYFKKMRELVELIEGKIQYGDNKILIEEIKSYVKTIELIKT